MSSAIRPPTTVLAGTSRGARSVRTEWVTPSTVLALVVLVIVLLWALAPALFAPYDPLASDTTDRLAPPSAEHWFGTDHLGRDVYSRVVFGAGSSLSTSALALAIGLVLGGLLGLAAGLAVGGPAFLLQHLIDVLLAFPGLLLAMALITALGAGSLQLGVAVGLALIGVVARVMRGEVLRIRKATFVDASIMAGSSRVDVAVRRILPNAASPAIALAVLEFGQAILIVAALSFLGFGTPPPSPEWGGIVSGGRDYLAQAWWICGLPGLVIAAVVISLNRLSLVLKRRQESR